MELVEGILSRRSIRKFTDRHITDEELHTILWAFAVLALVAYLTVGIVIPLVISKASGDTGMQFRTKSGDLSAFVLDSLRGLPETIQPQAAAAC